MKFRPTLDVADLMLALFVLYAMCCGPACSHACPKPPPCVPPPPVVTVVRPPPCSLPALPDPLPQLGIPDPQRDGYFVPRQSWALLGGYVAGMRQWIVAAAGCLTAGRHAP